MRSNVLSRCALCIAAALALPVAGCFFEGEAVVESTPARVGAVTIRWSVDGSFSPAACDAFFVANARVDLYDAAGTPISTTFVDCRAFSARFDLTPGRYSARVQMVDGAGRARSTSLAIAPFSVVGGTNLNLEADFPRDSFY